MDNYRPPLPHLLDIMIPNSQPESSSRRPMTSSNTMRSQYHYTSPDLPKSAKGNNPWSQTQNSFRQGTPIAEKNFQNFCFSTFRSPQKALPKLYSGPQHEVISQKFKDLKERYQRLYKKIDGEEDQMEGVTEENLKEIYLEAEKMFSATYSVKYFGIQGEELGIASKRVPMNQTVNTFPTPRGVAKNRTLKKDLSMQENVDVVEERNGVSRQGQRVKNLAMNSNDNMKSSPDIRKDIYDLSLAKKVDGFKLEETPQPEESQQNPNGLMNPSYNPNGKNVAKTGKKEVNQSDFASGSEKNPPQFKKGRTGSMGNLDKVHGEIEELDSERHDDTFASNKAMRNPGTAQASTRTQTQTQTRGGTRNERNKIGVERDLYVVTQYMIPKKLQTVKKSKNNDMSANQTQKQWVSKTESQKNLNKIANTHRAIQERYEKEVIVQGYAVSNQNTPKKPMTDKRVMSMEKVKRSLLRNVHVEKAWEARPFRDELDVPEKFRTYEVKKIMADNAKYSYAKLLGTMHTNERPETALVENTEKMERILAVRDEKKKFLGSRSMRRSGEFEEMDKRDSQGNYVVKVWYPRENELFNRFWKIKSNVAGDEQ